MAVKFRGSPNIKAWVELQNPTNKDPTTICLGEPFLRTVWVLPARIANGKQWNFFRWYWTGARYPPGRAAQLIELLSRNFNIAPLVRDRRFNFPSGESFRKEMAKRWDTIPSEVRLKCINDLEQARKSGRIPMVDYGMLDSCINDLTKK
jgi:hypothetical protein